MNSQPQRCPECQGCLSYQVEMQPEEPVRGEWECQFCDASDDWIWNGETQQPMTDDETRNPSADGEHIPGSIQRAQSEAQAVKKATSDDWVHVRELERLVDAWETKAEAFEMTSPIMDLTFAHAHRDCIEDLETVIENSDQHRQSGL